MLKPVKTRCSRPLSFPHHGDRLRRRAGFPENLAVDDDDGVGAKDPGIGMEPRDGARLRPGQPQDMFPGGFAPAEVFVDAARDDFKAQAQLLQQLDAARRGRGQDDAPRRLQTHVCLLSPHFVPDFFAL